jgi:hypothetical protein
MYDPVMFLPEKAVRVNNRKVEAVASVTRKCGVSVASLSRSRRMGGAS